MAKPTSKYTCQQCEYQQTRFFGRCPNCGEWNTAVEVTASPGKKEGLRGSLGGKGKAAEAVSLTSLKSRDTKRVSTNITELDRVLGGGLVAGQVALIAGEPGIGKSTLLLQVSDNLAKGKGEVIYVSGEESANQIKIRADRLKIKNKNLHVLEETDIDSIIATLRSSGSSLSGVVIDSIQTINTTDLSGMSGSIGQVRECTYRLVRLAKTKNVPLFIVGHVTKQGNIAGPAVLMHMVDTVLWFEGDKSLTLRLLRAVKNRFGTTDEVGVFSMKDEGLVSMSNPEKIFLTKSRKKVAGNIKASVLQGTRPILVEIQSLVVPTKMAYPKRIAQGIDSKRLEILLAVLQQRCNLPLYDFDCFVNVAGGISIKNDPSADLAICLSVASAYFDKAFAKSSVAIGEVGLLGDIREVVAQEKRIKDSKRLGYTNTISKREVSYLQQAIKKYLK